jgi:hypothetical protein
METISFTQILIALIGTAGTVIAAVAVAFINSHVKDAQLRKVLENAVKNSLGAVQQGAQNMVLTADPKLVTGLIPQSLVPGVQYVLDNASEAVERFGQTPEVIANKIVAQIGLGEIATNLAVSASPPPIAVPPMTPVDVTADIVATADLNRVEAARHTGV